VQQPVDVYVVRPLSFFSLPYFILIWLLAALVVIVGRGRVAVHRLVNEREVGARRHRGGWSVLHRAGWVIFFILFPLPIRATYRCFVQVSSNSSAELLSGWQRRCVYIMNFFMSVWMRKQHSVRTAVIIVTISWTFIALFVGIASGLHKNSVSSGAG